ncbi:hypothetical protein C8Q78DRAFT_727006 [Trametes maxima]|nr:hypothetical protein C8Q78DRAFT_727006 [Trametes maxima]
MIEDGAGRCWRARRGGGGGSGGGRKESLRRQGEDEESVMAGYRHTARSNTHLLVRLMIGRSPSARPIPGVPALVLCPVPAGAAVWRPRGRQRRGRAARCLCGGRPCPRRRLPQAAPRSRPPLPLGLRLQRAVVAALMCRPPFSAAGVPVFADLRAHAAWWWRKRKKSEPWTKTRCRGGVYVMERWRPQVVCARRDTRAWPYILQRLPFHHAHTACLGSGIGQSLPVARPNGVLPGASARAVCTASVSVAESGALFDSRSLLLITLFPRPLVSLTLCASGCHSSSLALYSWRCTL